MKKEEIQAIFIKILKNDEDISVGVAAIKTLLAVIEQYKGTTVRELHLNLQLAVDVMRNCDQPVTAINSCCELFMRFITYTKLDEKSFEDTKQIMLQRGHTFLDSLLQSRAKIAKAASPFVRDGWKILTHSKSRVVLQALLEAARNNKRFHVFVTMSGPDNVGAQMHEQLEAGGIESTLILDSAVGYIMEQVDVVMVGAEGVTESGGIINKIASTMSGRTNKLAYKRHAYSGPRKSFKRVRGGLRHNHGEESRLKAWRSEEMKKPVNEEIVIDNSITLLADHIHRKDNGQYVWG